MTCLPSGSYGDSCKLRRYRRLEHVIKPQHRLWRPCSHPHVHWCSVPQERPAATEPDTWRPNRGSCQSAAVETVAAPEAVAAWCAVDCIVSAAKADSHRAGSAIRGTAISKNDTSPVTCRYSNVAHVFLGMTCCMHRSLQHCSHANLQWQCVHDSHDVV